MMIEPLLMLLAGFALLVLGSEGLVRGATITASALGVPPLIIGLTIIAAGTSAPELTVSLAAAWRGETEIAIGNVVGSNIANILLVLGAMALARPFLVKADNVSRDGWVMMAVTILFAGLAFLGVITPLMGIGFLLLLIGYMVVLYRSSTAPSEDPPSTSGSLWRGALMLVVGLVVLIYGAGKMVEGAVQLAELLGVAKSVIALALLAIGTSLPELAISIAATWRGQAGLALGNIIGSNIANILLILGISAQVLPLPIPADILARDIWVMLAAAAIGFYILSRAHSTGRLVGRGWGAAFLSAYIVYIIMLFV